MSLTRLKPLPRVRWTTPALLTALFTAWLVPSIASARTITIDDTHVTMMAHISPEAPHASWVGRLDSPGTFATSYLEMVPGRRLLIQYPLSKIPPGQRIVSAQWFIPIALAPANTQRLFIWRLLVGWGPGVCDSWRTI